ncbi:ferredoxin, 2Fe-2S [Paenibacillus sp. UNCCL117]|uniref:2Fe-2S iron-sulfur cluster-binding protein n=1 Tax=unclassified Paenibacillus TaxID=185978 RepID=UPI0008917336|nr:MULTISPECIES: 2Fe-2S iron-sulfur cluster-binding protein [unclassified Paenibacillus]SDC40015.1 ferredoxin, 2Fe-2S [Paenibacillus sp. cl123]SFW13919.1 ferredoxin, 2Fe-2S [Paenibacillus sp. UNCCL117]
MITLKGRSVQKTVEPELGLTLLDLAIKHKVDWSFSCTRGTCSRCRCIVKEGAEHLNEPTDAELDNLEPEEFEQGLRLGCQTVVRSPGHVSAALKPLF